MSQSTITSAFDTEQTFVDLMHECGASQNEIDRIVDDGFGSMKDLVVHHENNIETFREYLKMLNKTFGQNPDPAKKVYFPPPVVNRLMGCLFYSKVCYYDFHVIPDLSIITRAKASDYYKVYEGLLEENKAEPEKDVETTIPELKGASNWRSFRDLVTMKLSMIQGKAGFPIVYVIDKTDRAANRANIRREEINSVNFEEDDIFTTRPVHFGKSFKEDNKRVWNVIKSLLLKTSSYDHIIDCNRTMNGRKAWDTLVTFYEGEDFKQRLQDDAFILLNNSIYKGNTNRNTFESYVNKHLKAHKLLMEAGYNQGIGMDDSTKIQHFKSGIRFEAGLEHALTTARTMGLQKGTFQSFVSFLSAEVDQKNSRKRELQHTTSNSRGISSTSSHRSNQSSNNYETNKSRFSEVVEGKRVEGRAYPSDEWRKMSVAQRSAITRLNKKRRAANRKDRQKRVKSTTLSRDSISSLSEAVVAGIAKDAPETDTNEKKQITFKEEEQSKPKATSGQVGRFLSRSRS